MHAALMHVVRTEGWQALFSGLGTASFSTAIASLVYYYFYALLRDAVLRLTRRGGPAAARAPSPAPFLLRLPREKAGAACCRRPSLGGARALPVAMLAGSLNVLLTNPLWVVVTRLQAARRAAPAGGGAPALADCADEECGPLSVARAVYKSGGLRAFWVGVAPSLMMVSNPAIQARGKIGRPSGPVSPAPLPRPPPSSPAPAPGPPLIPLFPLFPPAGHRGRLPGRPPPGRQGRGSRQGPSAGGAAALRAHRVGDLSARRRVQGAERTPPLALCARTPSRCRACAPTAPAALPPPPIHAIHAFRSSLPRW